MKKFLILFLAFTTFSCEKPETNVQDENLMNLKSKVTETLAWEEYIPSNLDTINYLEEEFTSRDVKHTIVLFEDHLYEFYDEELASKIPVTVVDNEIEIKLPDNDIVTLTIQSNGSLSNQADLFFNSVSIDATENFSGGVRRICEAACLATYRLLGVPRFLDSICCFWLSDKWDGVPWLS